MGKFYILFYFLSYLYVEPPIYEEQKVRLSFYTNCTFKLHYKGQLLTEYDTRFFYTFDQINYVFFNNIKSTKPIRDTIYYVCNEIGLTYDNLKALHLDMYYNNITRSTSIIPFSVESYSLHNPVSLLDINYTIMFQLLKEHNLNYEPVMKLATRLNTVQFILEHIIDFDIMEIYIAMIGIVHTFESNVEYKLLNKQYNMLHTHTNVRSTDGRQTFTFTTRLEYMYNVSQLTCIIQFANYSYTQFIDYETSAAFHFVISFYTVLNLGMILLIGLMVDELWWNMEFKHKLYKWFCIF